MKKLMAIAACVMLSGSLLVSGTLAADLNRMASDIFKNLANLLGDRGAVEDGGRQVDVEIVTGDTVPQLYPGGEAQQTCSVANRGAGAVYFRLACAVQYDAASWSKLKINFEYDDDDYTAYPAEDNWQEITISGTPYRMKVFTYQKELPPDGTASPVTVQIDMDASVTNEMLSGYRSDFLQMKALAVETAVFNEKIENASAETVLNLALPLTEDTNPF